MLCGFIGYAKSKVYNNIRTRVRGKQQMHFNSKSIKVIKQNHTKYSTNPDKNEKKKDVMLDLFSTGKAFAKQTKILFVL